MDNFLPIAYFQEKFVPFAEANISIATHALHYGTGAFGGMRGLPNPQNPREILLFRLDRHCQRLSQSAQFLHYELPAEQIQKAITEFVHQNQPQNPFYIRPFVYTSDLGIAPRLHKIEKSFFIYGIELGDYLSPDGVSCRISSWLRQEDRSLPLRGKISGAYITSSLAKTEAVESGFDEAILMNTQGKVSEASGMNIFVIRQGRIFTPPTDQDILEGITRDSLIQLARDIGLEVVERPIDKSELIIADEVFLSGTAAKVTPVKRVENFVLPSNNPLTQKLRDKLTAITENRDPTYQDWTFPISLD
ncbi:Branched-chain-amino-acid aminotransferase [Acaryochloris thomasi RCC1774]|uniref:Branched-chain-amino-acid aminotransferase n=1 Tax=Acaryochloris thomasi RCC1774 TaxID=1764569 RepID=A0A2W1JHJ2_9CYAN|nr:branched-chain amino acid transaminase [Acaryochloris thomasi]PZD73020.1 Branched-chain-amino-acid aminotransferase [Acaryochloris thomasi RCC1774]